MVGGFFGYNGAMNTDLLDKLFGNPYRAKVLRLFVANPDTVFDLPVLAKRVGVSPIKLRKEIKLLRDINFIKPKTTVITVKETKGRGNRAIPSLVKKKVNGWQLYSLFPFVPHLKNLLNTELLYKRADLGKRFKSAGKLTLLAISGVFTHDSNSRADLVIVGDTLKRNNIEKAIKLIESEIGRELNYATFETKDFVHRFNSSDRFVRDLLDYPHERIINKLPF